jgi:hypothetical protein
MTDPLATSIIVLTLLIGVGVAILAYFLYAIARFFEQKSGRRSWSPLFLVPVLACAVRYAWAGGPANDPLADLGQVIGGATLCGLGYFLLHIMTGDR